MGFFIVICAIIVFIYIVQTINSLIETYKKGLKSSELERRIRDYESKDKQKGIEEKTIKEKYCGWRAIHEMLAHDVMYLEQKFDEIKM